MNDLNFVIDILVPMSQLEYKVYTLYVIAIAKNGRM